MEKQNWNQIGNEIKDLVQDAVRSQDYSRLNESVSRTVRQAMEQVNRGLANAAEHMASGPERTEYVDPDPREQARKRPRDKGVAHGARESAEGERIRFTDRWVNQPVPEKDVPGPFARVGGLRTRAYARMILGGILAAGLGVGLLVSLPVLLLGRQTAGGVTAVLILAALFAGSLILTVQGAGRAGRLNRFRNYCRLLRGRSYYELEALAAKTGKSLKYIRKDLRGMLEDGWFTQGRMDRQETCLIVTQEAWEQYQAAQKEYEERKRREALRQEQEKALTPEAQEILREGRAYLEKIHLCGEKIRGSAVSSKISRMEELIGRIFEQVKKQPEAAEDLKRMMQYYLPTTVKLLEAYADMDSQPVQGENITSAKKEIEDTLDTLNYAFEKLLDEIFRDIAWDVSTDISVLHTLLAQEGLTKNTIKDTL